MLHAIRNNYGEYKKGHWTEYILASDVITDHMKWLASTFEAQGKIIPLATPEDVEAREKAAFMWIAQNSAEIQDPDASWQAYRESRP